MRLHLPLLLGLAVSAALALPAAADPQASPTAAPRAAPSSTVTALELEREVARLAAAHPEGSLWPGFDPLAVPLAVYDGTRTVLFRHPSPPEGFVPAPELGAGAHAFPGRHPSIVANTGVDLGGVITSTFLLDASVAGRSAAELGAVAVHEAFHSHQHQRQPDWMANEADLFTYPTTSAGLLALQRLEAAALRRALAAGDDTDAAACWARGALALRGERHAGMEPAYAAYDRGTELNEGLATYVEMRAAGRGADTLPSTDFAPADVRRRAYTSGAALALLLDRVAPEWRTTLAASDTPSLDGVLATAVGPGRRCDVDADVVAAARAKAVADVAVLEAARAKQLADFEARPGWRVVVEAADGHPLRSQGFDPLNVQPLDGARVLHTRFLRLGNDSGKMEVMGAAALTDGAGTHPLFQGVRRVVLTGLAEPEIAQAGGTVTVKVPGLTLAFADASVERRGEAVTVRLAR